MEYDHDLPPQKKSSLRKEKQMGSDGALHQFKQAKRGPPFKKFKNRRLI